MRGTWLTLHDLIFLSNNLNSQEIFERAKLGPDALLKFLNWEGREKTRWTMTILVGELRQALHPDAKASEHHDCSINF